MTRLPGASADTPSVQAESCWTTAAQGIARCHPRLPLERLQSAARQVVELLAFLGMCRARRLVSGQALDGLTADRQPELRLAGLAEVAEAQLGPGLFRVRPGDAPGDVKPPGFRNLRIEAAAFRSARDRWFGAAVQRRGKGRPEWLGAIHERLVGLELRRGAGGRLRTARGAAAKRHGGIYYTPEGIAGYLVSQAVGGRLGEIPAGEGCPAELAILDPACGCGSLLLAACRHLATWLRRRDAPQPSWLTAKSLHGVDLDPEAVLAARRSLWLEIMDQQPRGEDRAERARRVSDVLAAGLRSGDVLTGPAFEGSAGRFDAIIGNPPYHRERNGKPLLDRIAATRLGRRYRNARMDLWHYFVHRSLELLKPGARLSFIVGAYWTSSPGAAKLHRALRESAHVEEIFLLDGLKVFEGVSGRHMILTLRRGPGDRPTTIKRPSIEGCDQEHADAAPLFAGKAPLVVFRKSADQLFRDGRIDVEPPCDELLTRLARATPLGALGEVRQGIAENPATVTRKANQRHGGRWRPGEGVFALTPDELDRLQLPARERCLVRPYHDLCDLGRYFLASESSRALLYTTGRTCPEIDRFPTVRDHLARFRPIMEARRETRAGARRWWQLHWPREERLWRSAKIVALQMGRRPGFVPTASPVYVPFSANAFIPHADTREHLHYLTAVLNSRLAWKWYAHHAKRRGAGLEINGHVLARTPIRRIDFSRRADKARHDELVGLVDEMLAITRRPRAAGRRDSGAPAARIDEIDRRIDSLVYALYDLSPSQIATVDSATRDRQAA